MIAFHNSLIEIPEWNSITLIEFLWLLSGVMALIFSAVRLRPLWHDYQRVKHLDELDLCIIAWGYVRREALRLVTALVIVSIGIWVCSTYSPVPGPARISMSALFLTIGLFLISLIVSVQSLLDWRDRAKTIEIVVRRGHD